MRQSARRLFASVANVAKSKFQSSVGLETSVTNALRKVLEPVSGRSLVAIGAVGGISFNVDQTRVAVEVDLFVPGHPASESIRRQCGEAIRAAIPSISHVDVSHPVRTTSGLNAKLDALSQVEHIILVSSCKGGVGKSTVSVNLAMTLAKRGLRVGLLDADIYGPSLPMMVHPVDVIVRKVPGKPGFVQPLVTKEGLKILSFGHVNPKSATGAGGKGAAVMRGPIATRVINQLLAATEWGELDYLVIDMPPGTGDIQITVTQTAAASGAVLVTTPHPLSLVDSAKGIAMFEDLQIKPLAIVENMSYFECDQGKVYHPFGLGGRDNFIKILAKSWRKDEDVPGRTAKGAADIDRSLDILKLCPMHKIPLNSSVSGALNSEESVEYVTSPLVVRSPDSKIASIYSALADDVIREILRQQLDAQILPSISYSEIRGGVVLRYFQASNVSEYVIPARELRIRNPKTGELLPNAQSITLPRHVKPIHFDLKGNYGVAIQWSDGHYADIFPFDVLKGIVEPN